jgi:hypothetical protein
VSVEGVETTLYLVSAARLIAAMVVVTIEYIASTRDNS